MTQKCKEIVLFGASGHVNAIIEALHTEDKFKVAAIIDKSLSAGEKFKNIEVLGSADMIGSIGNRLGIRYGLVAIGDNYVRSKIVQKVTEAEPSFEFINCIHPNASIASNTKMGVGNVVMPGAVVNADTILGNHCVLGSNSTFEHDSEMGDYCFLAPSVAIGGNCNIKSYTSVGIGARVVHNVSIGENCIIGAGSTVIKDALDNGVYVGRPAAKLRNREHGDSYF